MKRDDHITGFQNRSIFSSRGISVLAGGRSLLAHDFVRFADPLSIHLFIVMGLTVAFANELSAQRWHGAKIARSPAYHGALSDDSESIVIEGRFTDTYTTYKVIDEVANAVRISDGNTTGWVSKIHLNPVHNPRAPEQKIRGDSKHPMATQSVTVIEWNTELKVGMSVVARAQTGDQLVVQAAFGEWYRLQEHGGCCVAQQERI